MNQGARARLLVVDDEQGIVAGVVTTALNSAGYQVDSTDQAHTRSRPSVGAASMR